MADGCGFVVTVFYPALNHRDPEIRRDPKATTLLHTSYTIRVLSVLPTGCGPFSLLRNVLWDPHMLCTKKKLIPDRSFHLRRQHLLGTSQHYLYNLLLHTHTLVTFWQPRLKLAYELKYTSKDEPIYYLILFAKNVLPVLLPRQIIQLCSLLTTSTATTVPNTNPHHQLSPQ